MGKLIVGVNDLATVYPDLATEWDYEKNGGLKPIDVTYGSGIKVWWLCKKHKHSWQATICNRTANQNCPFCSNRKVLIGYNDLTTFFPELAEEWDYEKNSDLKPTDVTSGSNKKVWWLCKEHKHSWQDTVVNRTTNNCNCPFCSNHKVLQGFNDLATFYPNLVEEWDYDRNGDLKPTDVTSGSNKKVWWVCKAYNHSWQATINSRTYQGCNCPICANIAVIKGFNDLATTNPELLDEWDYEKNTDISPSSVCSGTARKVWWICRKCGRSWKAEIRSRSQGIGCAVCSGKACGKGINDLATVYPEIAEEFDTSKNGINADEISAHSPKKVWWKCRICGHLWQAAVSNRTGVNHTGCPHCNKDRHTSFPEQAIFYYVKHHFSNAVNSYIIQGCKELDIYIPSMKLGIEYDGLIWHTDCKSDEIKNNDCTKRGITLIRIRENGLPKLQVPCTVYTVKPNSTSDLENAIIALLTEQLHIPLKEINVNIQRDIADIQAQYRSKKQSDSVSSQFPDIAEEWHKDKNGDLTPDKVTTGSGIKVWWKCKNCGFEWRTAVYQRTKIVGGTGCPKCKKEQAHAKYMAQMLKKTDTLQETFPQLANEWNFDKNGDLTPDKVAARSHQKVWWKCSTCGNEWQAIISNRAKGHGCLKCVIAKRKQLGTGTRKVLCIDTQMTYDSITDVERDLGISHSCVIACCKGRHKTAGGYHWKYADE